MSSLGQFNLLDKDTRLIKYNKSIYKVKLQYRSQRNVGDDSLPCCQEKIQLEIELVMKSSLNQANVDIMCAIGAIRAVLAMSGNLHSFRTDHFLIYPERKYWNTASLLKFFERGHELRGDPHMIYLTVEDIPDHLRETNQTEETPKDGSSSKRKFDENVNQRAGPSGGTKKARTPASASKSSRLRKRRKSSQQDRTNDSESTTDVNSSSDHENERPKFHSPPRKHRRYALRKRSASQPHAGGEPSRGKRMLMLSKQNRYMADGVQEMPSGEARGQGSQRHYQQPSPDDMPLQYAVTASNLSQPAHPQGGVILQDMLNSSPNEIAQHQLEEQMRLQRLAGPANVNRSHPAFSSPDERGDAEAPPSALRRIIDVVLTPAKKLFLN